MPELQQNIVDDLASVTTESLSLIHISARFWSGPPFFCVHGSRGQFHFGGITPAVLPPLVRLPRRQTCLGSAMPASDQNTHDTRP